MVSKLRDAMSFCKENLDLNFISDRLLKPEDKVSFEKCLTENYLLKYGANYFGKRDLIYLDLYGSADVRRLDQSV